MSVIKSKRSKSKFQVIINAIDLKDEIHNLCILDFGIKDSEKIVRQKFYYGSSEYKNEKYVLELHQAKQRLHYLSDEIVCYSRAANRIKMLNKRQCDLRLNYQDRCINCCEMIIAKLQDVTDTFNVNLNLFKKSIELIDEEIILLKRWKEYTNKVYKTIN